MTGFTTAGQAVGDFVITRRFDATCEEVFDAWTEPAQVAAWFGPRGLTTPLDRLSMDVRPGGSWSLTMVSEIDGTQYPVSFEYREVSRPHRLVLTSSAPRPDGSTQEVLLTMTLVAVPGGVEMTFAVTNLVASADNASLRDGWASSLECLAAHLGGSA